MLSLRILKKILISNLMVDSHGQESQKNFK